ncbi:pentatricopeptide repeat-containing protein At2g03880, mitochondrial-like [Bidens hawaiensis]|uniref:pentatricopeptide repeat-containing protein At2g03880, mitochondrial-like n=1 Tax=Bidens hawaiensis TaxID=980011 RepID=UPI0040490D3F
MRINHPLLPQIKALILTSANQHTLNTLLTNSHPHHAFTLYTHMLQHPHTHNHFTFYLALTHSLTQPQLIHTHLIKSGHFSHTYILNTLIHFYITQNDTVSAYNVFDNINYPNVVSWTSIISGFSKCGFHRKAIDMFRSMNANVSPNGNTFVSVLAACGGVNGLNGGKAVHGYWLRRLCEENVIVDNALLCFYLRVGSVESARHLFDEMPKRDVVSWTAMIGGFVRMGDCEKAVEVFDEMVRGGVRPNEATVVNVAAACASIGSLSLCESVDLYVRESSDIPIEGNVGNAFVNMYVKCGSIKKAVRVFKSLRFKDTIAWSTMINGLALNGLGHRVLPLFGLMLVHGVTPDDVTFISLLTACSHSGLVDEGLMLFKGMVKSYGVSINEKHCACVVDLYARAGRLKEAEEFVKGMGVEPDGPVWGALVSGCRVHGNEAMVRTVGESLVDKGASGGTLSLVSHSYASSSRWDESVEFRNRMSCLGLKKIAGSSWIELDV